MDARVHLGEEVRRARLRVGIRSREQLAKRANVSVRSIAKLESPEGERPVGRSVLDAVAAVLPGWTTDTPKAILEGEPAPSGEEAPTGPAALYVALEQAGWTSELEDRFQMLKRMLNAEGLELTPSIYLTMRQLYELNRKEKQPKTADNGK